MPTGDAPGRWSANSIACAALLVVAAIGMVLTILHKSHLVAWKTTTLAWLPFAVAALALVLLPKPKGLRRAAIVIVVLAVLLPVLRSPAQFFGDASEYFQMELAFMSRGAPDLRPGDTEKFLAEANRERIQPLGILEGRTDIGRGYFPSKTGASYSYHFWLSSLVAAPLGVILRLVGIGWLKAFQVLNALLFVVAFIAVLFWAKLPTFQRQVFAAVWAVGPILWYMGAPQRRSVECVAGRSGHGVLHAGVVPVGGIRGRDGVGPKPAVDNARHALRRRRSLPRSCRE